MANEFNLPYKKIVVKGFQPFKHESGYASIYILGDDEDEYPDFECAGDEVLVESSPPASPAQMAARLATPSQSASNGAASPGGTVRELIVIPEIQNTIHLQHAIQQVSTTVVEVNGDNSSGQSSPSNEAQHTYITVTSEGVNGVNYQVQYVEPQELYTPAPQTHMEPLRSYSVYGSEAGAGGAADGAWCGAEVFRAPSPPPAPRMPPATVQWLLDNYETADGVSLPRSTLYAHYIRHCTSHNLDPVNAASFGKLIRSVFIGLRTRRLGTRGNSKYHYYGIRAKPNASDSPPRPESSDDKDQTEQQGFDGEESREREPTEQNQVSGANSAHRQYLGTVTPPDPPELIINDLPDDVPTTALEALRRQHREHGALFLEAVSSLDVPGVERARRELWRAPALCKRTLKRLVARPEVALWLHASDLALHQRAVDLLLPDVLRPIPPHLTQAIRNFAKSVETALSGGASAWSGACSGAARRAGSALSAALRRYTSLNHLAQAARAVLTNQHQIQQMLSDLNRVDFRVVREQAAWACACSDHTAHRLEQDFKATLGRGAGLEQWASWLERCVVSALSAHEESADYTSRARRLLLDWSFYSSLVIRELTLRSAASFGSFHLIRLLFDEYVAFLVERRVATHLNTPPIAVMHANVQDSDEEAPTEEARQAEVDEDDPDWEWADDDDDDDDLPLDKKPRVN